MFWEVGHFINQDLLKSERVIYGKQIFATLSQQLQKNYGESFNVDNLRRMMRFAQRFTDKQIVTSLASQLTWSHIIELLLKFLKLRLIMQMT